MENVNISDTNSFEEWLNERAEADRLKAAQFVCGIWIAVTLPSIMREFEAQLSQDQAKISKTLQRLLASSFHGMSVYNMQLGENSKIKKYLLNRFEISETVAFDESWFDEIDLRAGNLTRCKAAVQNYIALINGNEQSDIITSSKGCLGACSTLYKRMAYETTITPWDAISRFLGESGARDVSTWKADYTIELLYQNMKTYPDGSSNFWHRLLGLFRTYADDNKINWAALWWAFDQQAKYINDQAEIEITNKLLESAYDRYKAALRANKLFLENEEIKKSSTSRQQEIGELRTENEKSRQKIDELQAELKKKSATQELSGVVDAWEHRAKSAAYSSYAYLFLILAVIVALVAGTLYVIVCLGFGWLDGLLIPDGCANLGDKICVGLTQRTAFLTVIFLTLASAIFLVLRILLRGYNSSIFWRDDARERIAFAKVYINMLGNAQTSKKTDDYARIAYETLFRPANSKLPIEDVSVGLSIPDNLAKNLMKQ